MLDMNIKELIAIGASISANCHPCIKHHTAKARELYYLADPIDAGEAERLSIVNRAVAPEQLSGAVATLARQLANGPSVALAYMKQNMNLAETADLATALDQEARHMALTFRTEDHREAARAFVEKRLPSFKGK